MRGADNPTSEQKELISRLALDEHLWLRLHVFRFNLVLICITEAALVLLGTERAHNMSPEEPTG